MADHGMRFRRETRLRPGGTTTAYRLEPGGCPRGRVVFVHGTGNEALYPHIGMLKTLLLSGYEIHAADLDGHGRGGSSVYTPEGVGSAVPGMIEDALRDTAVPVHAVGESLGAVLVLAALAARTRIASAVAISPPLSIRVDAGVLLRELSGIARTSLRYVRRNYGWIGMIPAFGPVRRGTFPVRTGSSDALGYLGEVRRTIAALGLPDRLSEVRVPVLVIAGADDRVAGPEDPARIHRATPGSELRLLHGRTHLAASVDPRTRAATIAWIALHTPPRPAA